MKTTTIMTRACWLIGAGMFLSGVAVLLLSEPEVGSRAVKRVSAPIALSPVQTGTEPSWPGLARVAECESKKDDAGLAKIALATSKDDDKQAARLRVTALYALGNVGTPSALGILHQVLEDASQAVVYRMAAAAALAREGSDAEVAYLKTRMAAEPQKLVREKIRLVLHARGS